MSNIKTRVVNNLEKAIYKLLNTDADSPNRDLKLSLFGFLVGFGLPLTVLLIIEAIKDVLS